MPQPTAWRPACHDSMPSPQQRPCYYAPSERTALGTCCYPNTAQTHNSNIAQACLPSARVGPRRDGPAPHMQAVALLLHAQAHRQKRPRKDMSSPPPHPCLSLTSRPPSRPYPAVRGLPLRRRQLHGPRLHCPSGDAQVDRPARPSTTVATSSSSTRIKDCGTNLQMPWRPWPP